jgi:hypothetical protein
MGIKMHWLWGDRRLYGNLRAQIVNPKIEDDFLHSLDHQRSFGLTKTTVLN